MPAERERICRKAIREGRLRNVGDRCEKCGSSLLIRIHGCWRCESCGHKHDCWGG